MLPRFAVYCDFDGTVTIGDSTDFLLERLADPAWQDIEASWEKGEIGSRQCMSLQVQLIRGGWKAIVDQLNYVKIDPTFTNFVRWCQQEGIPVHIVSDGIDRVIYHLLSREGIKVDSVWANHLHETTDGSLSLSFPKLSRPSTCDQGICKCQLIRDKRTPEHSIIIGDGRSDFCWSKHADILFAKSKLLSFCKDHKIGCTAFEDFSFIRHILEVEYLLPTIPVGNQLLRPAIATA